MFRKILYKFLVLSFLVLIYTSSKCKNDNEVFKLVYIGRSTNFIIDHFNVYKLSFEDDSLSNVAIKITSDTMLFSVRHDIAPIDLLCLMKNNKCYYQEINVYCSPCADKIVSDILKDDYYKFKLRDGSNYISSINPNYLFRFGKSSQSTCTNLKFYMIKKP